MLTAMAAASSTLTLTFIDLPVALGSFSWRLTGPVLFAMRPFLAKELSFFRRLIQSISHSHAHTLLSPAAETVVSR